MSYFPFFMDLEGREGLVIGGGSVALRKVEKLRPYGAKLTVIAPKILPELKKTEEISCMEIPFTPTALEGKMFVIAASDDPEVNHEAALLCRERGILVNVVDDKEECSFLFPALVKRGELSVGISTGGASPSAAVYVNCSTRFTDGGEFGLGCEIGISTQKLHARGPFAMEALTTVKYRVLGDGQVR